MDDALYLGVDGGGTGCRARLEDAAGTVLGQGIAGPAATRFGIEASWQAIETAARHAIAEAGLDAARVGQIRVGVGVAGIGRKGARAALEAMRHPYAGIAFTSDAMIACLGAHGGRDGGIVIVGTGSCAIGRVEGRDMKFGGYGFPISDEGSGAYLGLRALQHSLRAHDGREGGSVLTRELMARFQDDPAEVVLWMDRSTATDYATFAPLVLRQADQGDAVARHVVQDAAEHVNGLVRALLAEGAPRVSLIGGLASAMEAWLAPDVRRRLSPTLGDAVSGALALAGRR
ncbi:BadF/BadG/BcrA/BcrD ATPase family protein [Nitrospirillum sp. BR 11164]|uniref:BadF/BadG/BcrA/BcrD ATPase family protein n=1 Tax=Nitrospirillum sp. BR 11164 TaxID=3104324 RepID=UPI002AFF5E24|nr:BadF/BadG/BcrA/BcrD ATPase family protein [Nitrospirillum sp. BR 11164]MEA1648585.1 BadF/BadG/BcrA/BcrD ATPase family protein [Nitrospirillum sp. BR 11164]